MQYRIKTGHFDPFWNDDFKEFPYVKQPIMDSEIQQWKNMGYDYVKSFSGSMYDNRNPMPEWVKTLEGKMGMYNQTYTFYRMDTLEIMPVHSDHFNTYCRLNNTTPDQVERAVMMLEDWKPGHYFELDGIGHVNWRAGDWFKWRGDVPHAASNIGVEPRYTLQITGMPTVAGQLDTLHYKNIPDMDDTSFHPLMVNNVYPKIPEQHVMVWMSNGHITDLATMTHTNDAVEQLNNNGLHIYLFEPINSYHKDSVASEFPPYSRHNQNFYTEFRYPTKPEDLRAEELDSIYEYAKRNKLTNVTVHTGDYNIEQYYTHYTDTLNLICDDIFLKSQHGIDNLDETFVNTFNKNFVCLNWRFTNHRQLVATFLAGDHGYLSWHHKANFDTLSKNLFFNLELWEHTHIEHYCKLRNNCHIVERKSPFIIDLPAHGPIAIDDPYHIDIWPNVKGFGKGETPATRNIENNTLAETYKKVFVDIITETRFAQPTANFSEKVFQAIQYQKPFIVVAPPKTLEYIRSLGFKTFNDYWDESYDDELHHGERLAKLFYVMHEVVTAPIDKLRDMYEDMRPIVEHNLKVYKEFIK